MLWKTLLAWIKGILDYVKYIITTPEYGISPDMESLILSGWGLKTFPLKILKLSQLKELNLCINEIEELPVDFRNLNQLEKLILHSNFLKELPDDIFENFTSLKILNLTNNQMNRLPTSICNLVSLEELNVSYNHLETLSNIKFEGLKKLKRLNLSNNRLSEISPQMSNLTELTHLDLSGNLLKGLPRSMKNMEFLIWLDLCENYNLQDDFDEEDLLGKTKLKEIFKDRVLFEHPILKRISGVKRKQNGDSLLIDS